ncbi:hypothetical protein KUCAC02_018611 [Chaenocephalus aceratus]|uniref:Uncharacterized protein n=1 Tax=Chaenocephalus aceratus TaxID=36190 RepID=A0ACB9W906_CHAAC|nr:hypothetical protein KUCAC02_018611 [Chaenocephalus aceratus]
MRDTLEYRQRLVHDPERSSTVPFSVFPRLLDTKGLILQDFSLLFGSETPSNTTGKSGQPPSKQRSSTGRNADFHTLAEALVVVCQDQRADDHHWNHQWDSDMASILLLLHLLSPSLREGRKPEDQCSFRPLTIWSYFTSPVGVWMSTSEPYGHEPAISSCFRDQQGGCRQLLHSD